MKVLTDAVVQSIQIENEQVHCVVETANDVQTLVLIALSAIGAEYHRARLERLGVELNPQGFVAIDDYCKTNVAGLYAIGDVAGVPCLAHKASHEAMICVEKIAGVANVHSLDRSQIPGCIFTHPQVASIGLTENAAKS